MTENKITPGKVVLTVIGLFAGLIIVFGSWFVVDVREQAVVFNTFTGLKQEVYGEGFHLKLPLIESVTKYDTKVQKIQIEASAASNDLQSVPSIIALNYHLDASKVLELHKTVGKDYEDIIIAPAIQESVKAATAQFTAEQLLEDRPKVKQQIEEILNPRLESRFMIVDDVSIIDFRFSEEFEKAIEKSQVAKQEVEQEKNNLQKVILQQQQEIEKGNAEAAKLKAQKEQITPELLKLRQIEVQGKYADKWDGKMPVYMITMGDGATPLLQLPPTNP